MVDHGEQDVREPGAAREFPALSGTADVGRQPQAGVPSHHHGQNHRNESGRARCEDQKGNLERTHLFFACLRADTTGDKYAGRRERTQK